MTTTTLSLKSPADVVAAVPIVLGFAPSNSMVMLTFGGPRNFHARVDLPPDSTEVPVMIAALLDPAMRHEVKQVIFVAYSADRAFAWDVLAEITKDFWAKEVKVVHALCVDGDTAYFSQEHPGVTVDVQGNRLTAEAVAQGHVVAKSRDELATIFEPQSPLTISDTVQTQTRESVEQAHGLVRQHIADERFADDEAAEYLLRSMAQSKVVRDVTMAAVERSTGRFAARFFANLSVRAPGHYCVEPLTLAAYSAWLAGDGALALTALDAIEERDQEPTSMSTLVNTLLTQAVPPTEGMARLDELLEGM